MTDGTFMSKTAGDLFSEGPRNTSPVGSTGLKVDYKVISLPSTERGIYVVLVEGKIPFGNDPDEIPYFERSYSLKDLNELRTAWSVIKSSRERFVTQPDVEAFSNHLTLVHNFCEIVLNQAKSRGRTTDLPNEETFAQIISYCHNHREDLEERTGRVGLREADQVRKDDTSKSLSSTPFALTVLQSMFKEFEKGVEGFARNNLRRQKSANPSSTNHPPDFTILEQAALWNLFLLKPSGAPEKTVEHPTLRDKAILTDMMGYTEAIPP
ncbi:hypothetical protein M231_07541 [Tremella mesenterica]|uniref:Uncharacterized protein n=1 Tax=Tremella mesenterica TaxID=5217 RepID=A0A4Q1BAY9_TREME|nr:uncharacterized protein TREMEDRAFT_73159 [Tremella mesenterica DSM 1558]EIW71016.1 hypothetical protein TREMEDRAFT_73159 [Tremella mesenterica DSM 1558]RXK35207.1 hypothetical protein M231_07541 [Tremella mesenterica]